MVRVTTFLAEFWSGFRETSALALLTAIGVFAMSSALLLWLFSPTVMAGKFGDVIPRYTNDTGAFATIEAFRIARHNHAIPSIYILGSSTIAQAFDEAGVVQKNLRQALGQDWQVHMLTSTLQSPLEQAALIETIFANHSADAAPKIVVFGAGYARISWHNERILTRWEDRLIGVLPQNTHELARDLGHTGARLGLYHWDNRNFILLNGRKALERLLTARPAKRDLAIFANPGRRPKNDPAKVSNRIIKSRNNISDFFALEQKILDLIPSEQSAVIYIDEGLLMAPSETLEETKAEINAARREMTEGKRVTFHQLFEEADLTPEMFHDPIHLKNGPIQTKLQNMLADVLIEQINARGF